MITLKRQLRKKINTDFTVSIIELQEHFGHFKSILIDEFTYAELSAGSRNSLILPIPCDCKPDEMIGKAVIIAPSHEAINCLGKTETRALEYGTVFTIDNIIWSTDGQVEGLTDGYLLMEVIEEYTITEEIARTFFQAKDAIKKSKKGAV